MTVVKAMLFAREKHQDQIRKYTREPYVAHLAEVAAYVHAVGCSDEAVSAAWLHDVVEDQNVTVEDLRLIFGNVVAEYVSLLTDLSPQKGMNRAQRKQITIDRLKDAPDEVQTVKLADLISNTKSIVLHDPGFAEVYLEEKRALMKVLTRGDRVLYAIAEEIMKLESSA